MLFKQGSLHDVMVHISLQHFEELRRDEHCYYCNTSLYLGTNTI